MDININLREQIRDAALVVKKELQFSTSHVYRVPL